MAGDALTSGVVDSALVAKIICLVLLGVIAFCCGLVPFVLTRLAHLWRKTHSHDKPLARSALVDLLVSCVLCLGGGVLLGTVFTHMIPEIRELFMEIEAAHLLPDMEMPAGEIFLCVGFFLVYFVEELVHAFLDRRAHKKEESISLPVRSGQSEAGDASAESHQPQVYGDVESLAWNEKLYSSVLNEGVVAAEPSKVHAVRHGHDHGSAISSLHAFRAYIVVLALSIHSVFEGFAVAFESSSRDVWMLFAAIATHKAIVSFCLGEQLVATKRSACFIISNLLVLSAASPIGVTIGLAVEQLDLDETSRLVSTGILQSLAAGTIIYVVFFEILGPERQKHSNGLLKFLAVLAGFCLIVAMHSTGGHKHGPAGAVGGHADHDVHLHHEIGHQHQRKSGEESEHPLFQSDYLARVQSESGHVLDTVRYIQSFRKQDSAKVSRDEVIDSMRNVVHEVASKAGHDDHSHGDHTVRSPTTSGNVRLTTESSHHDLFTSDHDHDEQAGTAPSLSHHEHHVEDAHADEAHEHGLADANDETHTSAADNEAHRHNHDNFMRTVEELAGEMDDVDSAAVGRTVRLIDTLDLIATEGTEPHGDDEDAAHSDHDGADAATDDHDSEHGDAPHGYDHQDPPPTAEQDDQQVQFVLQDPSPSPLSPHLTTNREASRLETSTAYSDLLSLTEVELHVPQEDATSVARAESVPDDRARAVPAAQQQAVPSRSLADRQGEAVHAVTSAV